VIARWSASAPAGGQAIRSDKSRAVASTFGRRHLTARGECFGTNHPNARLGYAVAAFTAIARISL
jgi:hypothetical protein